MRVGGAVAICLLCVPLHQEQRRWNFCHIRSRHKCSLAFRDSVTREPQVQHDPRGEQKLGSSTTDNNSVRRERTAPRLSFRVMTAELGECKAEVSGIDFQQIRTGVHHHLPQPLQSWRARFSNVSFSPVSTSARPPEGQQRVVIPGGSSGPFFPRTV